jgi:hypothetical protein
MRQPPPPIVTWRRSFIFFPDDSVRVAAFAVNIVTNTALTGATYDIDGSHHDQRN